MLAISDCLQCVYELERFDKVKLGDQVRDMILLNDILRLNWPNALEENKKETSKRLMKQLKKLKME